MSPKNSIKQFLVTVDNENTKCLQFIRVQKEF